MTSKLSHTYKSTLVPDKIDTLIIGSGIGGLALGALLSQAGQKVVVLERHYVPGGFTHTFERKGYEWDVGVHYIGEVHRPRSPLRKIFDAITEGHLQWAPMGNPGDVYDKIIIGNETFDFVGGTENFKQKLKSYFPQDSNAIDRYFEAVFSTTRAVAPFFMERALPNYLAPVARPFLCRKFYRYSDRTTDEVLSEITQNQKLKAVLSAQYGDYGLPPKESSFAIHAMVAKHYFEGGNYPIGGSAQFANTMIPVIQKSGGQVFVKAEVKSVVIENGNAIGVELANGDRLQATRVVSDAGAFVTFDQLVSREEAEAIGWSDKKQKISPSLAHLGLYLGFKKTAAEMNFPKWNYWIYPHDDHDRAIHEYRQNSEASLPVTYISFPSAKDPDFLNRCPGRSTMEVVGFAPYDWFSRWADTRWQKRGEDYEAFKNKLAERLLENVYLHIPQIKGQIDYMELSTPLSTRHFSNYLQGEIYGLDHTPKRFRQSWLRPQTPIKNLYLTGQDIVTAGIGGALMGGVLTASVILKRNLIKEMMSRS